MADQIPTGPRALHCPACLELAVHHFDRHEIAPDGVLSWFRCTCGNPRALDFVATPYVVDGRHGAQA